MREMVIVIALVGPLLVSGFVAPFRRPLGPALCAALVAWFAWVELTGCGFVAETKDIGADVAEVTYCPFADCGTVFLCTMPDASKNEWCWISGDADTLRSESGATSCEPTPRGGALGWPCLYQCPPAKGCNAYQSCFGCGG